MKRFVAAIAALAFFTAGVSASEEEARLLRFPAVGGENIVFSYAGNLYRVNINGGQAHKLTSDVGYEVFPRISPDGETIAFTGQFDGNTEVYTMPVNGGEPKRITYTALVERDMVGERMGPNNIVMCWSPDGKKILFRNKQWCFSGLRAQLQTVDADGGVPVDIPASEGGFCSYSPDGKYLAMNRMFREFRTWKYYSGGQADDIWIHKIGTTEIERIEGCDPVHQDIFPMWIGDEIFYLSDRDRTMNLFAYNVKSRKTEKLTDFTEYDCKFPSYSKEYVVFENGGYIYKYDVKERKCSKVSITLSDDNLYSRPEYRSVGGEITAYSISPDGNRVLMTARGDVFSLPAEKGPVYNITRSSNSHEREADWSPDGKNIAYFSDKSGEYQVYVAPSDNMEAAVQMTNFKNGYPQNLQWSPDGKFIYFSTDARQIYKLDAVNKNLECIIESKTTTPRGFKISSDGTWAAYTVALDNKFSAVFLYDIASGKSYQVTDGWYDASSPIFSTDGKYLFFTSSRNYQSMYSQVEWNASYTVSDYIFGVTLSKETPDPTLLKSDEYVATPAEKPAASKMRVDVDGIGQRVFTLPVESGRYRLVLADGNKLYYSVRNSLKVMDLETMKESDGPKTMPLIFTPDHKKALVRDGGKYYVSSFGGPGGKSDKPVPTDEMDMVIDHQAEWAQIYDESWRVTRDGFYVENMHGVDWDAIYDKYAVMLPYVKHRHDLSYLIGEMIGELAIGHAYISPGELPEIPRIETGLLGGRFSRATRGAFEVVKVFKGASWDPSLRSPLDEAGVKEGEFIIAVNGVDASQYVDVTEALIDKVGKTVSLTVASSTNGKNARTVYVKPVADESNLAYYNWVRRNIEIVDKASNGEIGYIHIPDMSTEGLDMFTKMFYSQLDKKALIIDDRMNGGGNVSPMILERLQREVYRVSMYRNGANEPVPNEAFYGPKVCLIDKYSSSDGDLFPYGFRQLGLGKLVGKRSWGGIVGISGSKRYLDGQDMRTPFFTSYSLDGEWIIEGHGVDPDIDVDINPFEDYLGKDAQLEKAIELMKEALKEYKPLPPTPAAPVKNAETWK